ncbi:DUF6263 family protein [Pedobacter nyackensis]|uniref:Thiol-disulfide isomerase or thioredoxin n=1 Tax=Pedobacter nyackensis TaxID=475255 RepID=A0A1W2DHN4_9SPHI|nr:DUF6263 family protein [Pedobacter nyackensis]SMC96987.1 Thiol-disulfide isomerase or thioredoxin [Pedobacter nyackensis]
MKKITLLTLGLTAAVTTYAQQLNVPKNKQFEYITKNTHFGTYKGEEQTTYAFKSLGKNASGNNVLECRLVKSIIKEDIGKSRLNTDSIHNTNLNNTSLLFPLAMLNKPFSVVVSPKGEVLSVDGIEPALKAAIAQWNLQPAIEKQLIDNANGFRYTMQGLFFLFPEKSLAISPEWENKDSGLKFKVGSKKNNSLIVNSSKKDTSGNSVQDKSAIDLVTGLKQTSQTEIKFGKMQGGVNGSQKISNSITKTKIDTSWINMRVKFSHWSTTIKNELGYDSVKIAAAFRANDQKFSKDQYYMVNKLSLIQQMRSETSYKIYDSLLLLTPNKYLEGTHHLFNKLGSALDKEGAASAYDVSKYTYKTESFNNWVQNSLAQYFLPYDDTANPLMAKSYELLELFMNDKDPLYREKIKPLYLWAMTEKQPQNTALVIKNAAEYTKMSDAQMHNGNAGRYALLMYNTLLKAKAQTEADSLLNYTIKKLEKYAADGSNPNRKAEQNILAHAWYLKYQTALATDSTKALKYLAKASAYSPKGETERAHISFYDRVFLKSKESYRDEYMNVLLKGGNTTEAMQLFAVQITANPESLAEMQKLYKTRFPNNDFKSFMVNNVINSWKTAPDFKLKNIDGKEQSLSDFKDKWLVLDFWGTWCGPCKEELPSVNKFYLELEEGKHGNTKFLSIACRDEENRVKTFINTNKYSIPVVMSDNKVEGDYKITGYPSKILVSPEGKMLNIDFGKDWKKVLKELNSIYAL